MIRIDDIIIKAEKLKSETLTGSITPERLGEILCDMLECLKDVNGEKIPTFDLLTSRTRRSIVENANGRLSDYFPIVRLKGETIPAGCTIDVYRYQNRGNKKYKKVLSAPLQDCEIPDKWVGGGYRSLVLPWSLQRIFWEIWEPKLAFHTRPYESKVVANNWIDICKDKADGTANKSNGRDGVPRENGPLFTATFGIRLVKSASGFGGEMKTFKIALLRDNPSYRFVMKLDRGTTVTTN